MHNNTWALEREADWQERGVQWAEGMIYGRRTPPAAVLGVKITTGEGGGGSGRGGGGGGEDTGGFAGAQI